MDAVERRRLTWRERRLMAWIAALPTAEPGRAIALLAQSVRALNTVLLDPVTRISLLRHYESSANDLAGVFVRPGLAGPMARVATTVHSEIAQGYQMALEPELGAEWRLLAVEGAMGSLAEVLRAAYRAYVPAPPGLWRRLHALFDSVANPTLELERLYIGIVLLGLSDPYALPAGGVDAAWRIIAEIGERAVLNDASGFAIVAGADKPAEPGRADSKLFLDTTSLLSELTRLRDDLKAPRSLPPRLASNVLPDLALRLCTILGETWRPGPRRRSLRVRIGGERLVCQGLAALQRLRVGDASAHRFVELDIPWGGARTPQTGDLGLALPRVTTWTIQDAGRTGLWLSCTDLDGPPPAPGTWIGVKDPSGAGSWQAATVRWLRRLRPREYAIGVALLGLAQTETILRIGPRRATFAASSVAGSPLRAAAPVRPPESLAKTPSTAVGPPPVLARRAAP